MTELLSAHGFSTGCITTDNITGATPASFYAHQTDRSETHKIAQDLVKSELSLFIGGGSIEFEDTPISNTFEILKDIHLIGSSKKEKIGHFISKKQVLSVLEGRGGRTSRSYKKRYAVFYRISKSHFF